MLRYELLTAGSLRNAQVGQGEVKPHKSILTAGVRLSAEMFRDFRQKLATIRMAFANSGV